MTAPIRNGATSPSCVAKRQRSVCTGCGESLESANNVAGRTAIEIAQREHYHDDGTAVSWTPPRPYFPGIEEAVAEAALPHVPQDQDVTRWFDAEGSSLMPLRAWELKSLRAGAGHVGHGCPNDPTWRPASSARAAAYATNLKATLAAAATRRAQRLMRTWGEREQVNFASRWELTARVSCGYGRSVMLLDQFRWEHMAQLTGRGTPRYPWEVESRELDARLLQRTAADAVLSRLGRSPAGECGA